MPPLLVMVALPAVLVSKNCRTLLLVMVALPAVLVSRNCRVPLLVMVALPAVLVSSKLQGAVVGDGGAAGRAGVEKFRSVVVGDGGAAGRAGVEETQDADVVGDGGAAGRAGVEEFQSAVVGDGGAAAVDDDAGAVEGERSGCVGEGVVRRPGVEGPAADRGVVAENDSAGGAGRAEEGGAGRHRGRGPVGGGVEIARAGIGEPGRVLRARRQCRRNQRRGGEQSGAQCCACAATTERHVHHCPNPKFPRLTPPTPPQSLHFQEIDELPPLASGRGGQDKCRSNQLFSRM